MIKRYSIMVQEFGSEREAELCRVDTNPRPIAQAATRNRCYQWVRIVDHQDGQAEPSSRARTRAGSSAPTGVKFFDDPLPF